VATISTPQPGGSIAIPLPAGTRVRKHQFHGAGIIRYGVIVEPFEKVDRLKRRVRWYRVRNVNGRIEEWAGNHCHVLALAPCEP
jgi:hypothetical protein